MSITVSIKLDRVIVWEVTRRRDAFGDGVVLFSAVFTFIIIKNNVLTR